MLPGESFCPEGSEYVGKGGYGVFKAEIRPAKVEPRFKNCSTQSYCYQNTQYNHNFQGRAIEITQRLLIALRGKALQDNINVPIDSFRPKTSLMWGFRKWFHFCLVAWPFLQQSSWNFGSRAKIDDLLATLFHKKIHFHPPTLAQKQQNMATF